MNVASDTVKARNSAKREIDLLPLIETIFKKLWMILIAAIIVAAGTFAVTKMTIKPTYRAGFTAYVNNAQAQLNKEYLSSSDIIAAHQLVLTYASILTSNSVLTSSAQLVNLDLNYAQLASMVSTTVQEDTEIIHVYVVSESKQTAYEYANAIAEFAPDFMAEKIDGSSMKIIDQPVFPEKRYKPSYMRLAAIGGIIGAILMLAFIVIRYYLDDTIHSESDLEKMFSIPVVGLVPDIAELKDDKSGYYPYSYGSDSYGVNKQVN